MSRSKKWRIWMFSRGRLSAGSASDFKLHGDGVDTEI